MKTPCPAKIKLLLPASLLLALLGTGCAGGVAGPRMDRNLPAGFRTPRQTFTTWVRASLAGDRQAVSACYWSGLGREELRAWLEQNLQPAARGFFRGMQLLQVEPVTLVEVNFSYRAGDGSVNRGTMVRTRQGWKLQRW